MDININLECEAWVIIILLLLKYSYSHCFKQEKCKKRTCQVLDGPSVGSIDIQSMRRAMER